jgi:hypothetical protein
MSTSESMIEKSIAIDHAEDSSGLEDVKERLEHAKGHGPSNSALSLIALSKNSHGLHLAGIGTLVTTIDEARVEYGDEFASTLKLADDNYTVLIPQPTDNPEDPLNVRPSFSRLDPNLLRLRPSCLFRLPLRNGKPTVTLTAICPIVDS